MRYHFISKRLVAAVLILPAVLLMSFKGKKISREEATALAETYVRCNGYTDAPADTTHKQFAYDGAEINDGMAALLKGRHNTMLPTAISTADGRGGWQVVFEYTPAAQATINKYAHTPHKSGAVICIDKYGTSTHLGCQDVILVGE